MSFVPFCFREFKFIFLHGHLDKQRKDTTAVFVLAMETICCDISKSDKPDPKGYPSPSRSQRQSVCYLWPSASARETIYTYSLLIWYFTKGKIGQEIHFFCLHSLLVLQENAILFLFVHSSLLCRGFSMPQQILRQWGPL